MSFAYGVTPGDVFLVLEVHEAADSEEDDAVEDALFIVRESEARVSEVALEYEDIEDRRQAAWREIEAILLEEGYLEGPSRLLNSVD